MIKLVIADDHLMLREGFKTLMNKIDGITVIGEAENGQQLLELVEQKGPDVVIMDIQMPIMDGITATTELHKRHPSIGVIALSMFIDNDTIIDMLKAGARGYLTKNTSKQELADAIQTVHEGGTFFSASTKPSTASLINRSQLNPYRNSKPANFNSKEMEIIQYICREYSSKQIASLVELAPRTVESYRQSILDKIEARNVVGLVLYAITHGLFSFDSTNT